MNYKSQLGYVMDLMELTGKDLAMSINVDRTLVSKWKNNARVIKPNNSHFSNLIEALIFFNSRRKDSTLERFFGKVYPNEDKNEPEYLEVCLRLWLIGKDSGNFNNLNDWRTSKAALYAAPVEIYQGNSGKRDAIIDFFNYALTLPAGQEIFISDLESMNWKSEDRNYYNLYHEKYLQLVECGHNITVIHNIKLLQSEQEDLAYFRLKPYYSGQVTSYYSMDNQHSVMEPSLYIIHRHMSLLSMCPDGEQANRYISVNRDPFTIQHHVRVFVSRIHDAMPMISTFSAKGGNLKSIMTDLLRDIDPTNIYYTAPQLPLVAFTKEALELALKDSNLEPQTRQLVEYIRVENKRLFMSYTATHELEILISQENLTADLTKDVIVLEELSTLCRQEITINKSVYKELLSMAYEETKTENNLYINVLPFEDFDILKDVVVWLFEDAMLYSTMIHQGKNFIVSDAPVIITRVLEHIQFLLMEYENAPQLITYLK